ncbi:unnamed protein product, partial [Prorocentrum cordatum]
VPNVDTALKAEFDSSCMGLRCGGDYPCPYADNVAAHPHVENMPNRTVDGYKREGNSVILVLYASFAEVWTTTGTEAAVNEKLPGLGFMVAAWAVRWIAIDSDATLGYPGEGPAAAVASVAVDQPPEQVHGTAALTPEQEDETRECCDQPDRPSGRGGGGPGLAPVPGGHGTALLQALECGGGLAQYRAEKLFIFLEGMVSFKPSMSRGGRKAGEKLVGEHLISKALVHASSPATLAAGARAQDGFEKWLPRVHRQTQARPPACQTRSPARRSGDRFGGWAAAAAAAYRGAAALAISISGLEVLPGSRAAGSVGAMPPLLLASFTIALAWPPGAQLLASVDTDPGRLGEGASDGQLPRSAPDDRARLAQFDQAPSGAALQQLVVKARSEIAELRAAGPEREVASGRERAGCAALPLRGAIFFSAPIVGSAETSESARGELNVASAGFGTSSASAPAFYAAGRAFSSASPRATISTEGRLMTAPPKGAHAGLLRGRGVYDAETAYTTLAPYHSGGPPLLDDATAAPAVASLLRGRALECLAEAEGQVIAAAEEAQLDRGVNGAIMMRQSPAPRRIHQGPEAPRAGPIRTSRTLGVDLLTADRLDRAEHGSDGGDPALPIFFGEADVKHCFNLVMFDGQMSRYFCYPSRVAKEFGAVGNGIGDRTAVAHDLAWPCALALPMGWTQSLSLAQVSSPGLVEKARAPPWGLEALRRWVRNSMATAATRSTPTGAGPSGESSDAGVDAARGGVASDEAAGVDGDGVDTDVDESTEAARAEAHRQRLLRAACRARNHFLRAETPPPQLAPEEMAVTARAGRQHILELQQFVNFARAEQRPAAGLAQVVAAPVKYINYMFLNESRSASSEGGRSARHEKYARLGSLWDELSVAMRCHMKLRREELAAFFLSPSCSPSAASRMKVTSDGSYVADLFVSLGK